MIPQRIHYCWFGSGPQSSLMERCIESWRVQLPGYEIKCWDESNSPMHLPYIQKAFLHKKWANISNLVRLYALQSEGGIYLDTDIEVVRSFDPLRSLSAFLGCEDKTPKVNNAVFGSVKGHAFVTQMLGGLMQRYDGVESSNLSSPEWTTQMLRSKGLVTYSDSLQMMGDIAIFPTRTFYPFHFTEKMSSEHITPETYTIHYWLKRG